MDSSSQNLEALQDIKRIMERSSRFISLSGLSGIAVGLVALAGALMAHYRIQSYLAQLSTSGSTCADCLQSSLMVIAASVLVLSLLIAAGFTFLKTQKEGIEMWGSSSKRLLWNTLLPMIAGGFLLWRMIDLGQYQLVAPGSLLLYGLALVNGSKYTIGEVRYLGYAEILLGVINLWLLPESLLFWAIGFGIFHIIYGAIMWWKYEKVTKVSYKGNAVTKN